MLDVNRLRATGLVLASIAMAIAGCAGLLLATLGRNPGTFLGSDWPTYSLASYETSGGRISAFERAGGPGGSRWGAIVGASTLECGVSLEKLGPDQEQPLRWLSLNGKGSTGEDLVGMVNLLFQDGLHPEAVVLAINPGMLARNKDFLADPESDAARFDPAILVRHIGARRWRDVEKDVGALVVSGIDLALPQRLRVSYRLQYLIQQAKRYVCERLGQKCSAVFYPARELWTNRAEWANRAPLNESEIRRQLDGLTKRGWLDAGCYATGGSQIQALVGLSRRCAERKVKELIVLLPETSRSRSMVPREATLNLRLALNDALGSEAPPIIDLRDMLPDSMFLDLVHLNGEGRDALTPRLRKILCDELGATSKNPGIAD